MSKDKCYRFNDPLHPSHKGAERFGTSTVPSFPLEVLEDRDERRPTPAPTRSACWRADLPAPSRKRIFRAAGQEVG
jgi:hypothetical protein